MVWIEKSVSQDHCPASFGKPGDADQWPSWQIFLSTSYTHERYLLSQILICFNGTWCWSSHEIRKISNLFQSEKAPKEHDNQLMGLCTARTAWSESEQAVRAVHSWNSWWLGSLWSDLVAKLVSVLFGKCTTLGVTKFWPMETRLPCGDQWKAEKFGAF